MTPTHRPNRFAATTLGALVLALPLLIGLHSAIADWKGVGMIQAVEGEVLAVRGQTSGSPAAAFSVLEEGMQLRLGADAHATLVHDREGSTYEIRGPALVTVSRDALAVEPKSAVTRRTSARPPVELAESVGTPAQNQGKIRQLGGESLDRSRAGLIAESAKTAPESHAESNKTSEFPVSLLIGGLIVLAMTALWFLTRTAVRVGVGVLIVAIGGSIFYYYGRNPDTQKLMAALEVAKKSNEQLVQARQAEQNAAKALELASQAEAEAKASGDIEKQKQLAEQTRLREAELQKQADLVKQREEEAKKTLAAAEEKKNKLQDSEVKKKAAEEKAKIDKAKADRAAEEKAVADKIAAEKASAKAAASAKVAQAKSAPPAKMIAAEERAADRAAEQAAADKRAADDTNKSKKPVAELPPEKIERVGRIEVAASDPNLLLLKQGKEAENGGDAKAAIKLYRQAYRNGSGEAAKLIGDIYVDGKGNQPRDYAESLVWYTRAEKQGVQVDRTRVGPAMNDPAKLFLEAREMERTGKMLEAVRLYKQAAESGSGPAAKRLGEIYETGAGGIAADATEAQRWYRLAASRGEKVPLLRGR